MSLLLAGSLLAGYGSEREVAGGFFKPGHSAASALFVVSPAFPPLFTLEVESPVVIYGLCKSSQDASDGINC